MSAIKPGFDTYPSERTHVRGTLFRKYFSLVVIVVAVPLLANGAYDIWSSYQQHKASLVRLQQEQASAAADKIGQFIRDIEGQVDWMTQLAIASTSIEQQRFQARLLLRQVPAITEFTRVDASGREQLRVSRLAMDVVNSGVDLSGEPRVSETIARKVYYGPVQFRRESEPYMTLARGGVRREAGVSIAEVNLKFIWDVVSQITVGQNGRAYVIESSGRLIAHPDISLVLRNTDLSQSRQVSAALRKDASITPGEMTLDVYGRKVLAAHAKIAPLDWHLFVELPADEAYGPIYRNLVATGFVLFAGLALALLASVILTRRIVRPIHELHEGAGRIGAGALHHRIRISTGDELQALGDQFNDMAARVEQAYGTLERKVDERTKRLQLANQAKSRFIAAASHDLRQPLHALGLFAAQLQQDVETAERSRIVARIGAAITAMNELFNSLLDISKLDADVLKPNLARFPIQQVFTRLEATMGPAAVEKNLRLRFVASRAWARSDAILLERILLNLVSNAIRYTERGGVVVGVRRRGEHLRIEVWDSGSGISDDQQAHVFAEFYRIESGRGSGPGLGLGLAIVDRLCELLSHRIEVASMVGKGSRFSVLVPHVPADRAGDIPAPPLSIENPCQGKVVVMIEDDLLVREGMRGLLEGWGCHPVMADTTETALRQLKRSGRSPDVVISDYRLPGAMTGVAAIERLRHVYGADLPAFLVTGDTAPEPLRDAMASGHHLLHKPVQATKLRALLSQVLKESAGGKRNVA